MFGLGEFKKQVLGSFRQLEQQISDLKRGEQELRSQNARMMQLMKNMGRKIVCRLPISLESLEKGLIYDLIFGDEIEGWKKAAPTGIIVDIRPQIEFSRGAIGSSVNIPLDQISAKIEVYTKDTPMLLICENGVRSASVSELLQAKGYPFIYVLKGGIAGLQKIERTGSQASESAREEFVANA
jgi:rhodanese-related sulfurtransferase